MIWPLLTWHTVLYKKDAFNYYEVEVDDDGDGADDGDGDGDGDDDDSDVADAALQDRERQCSLSKVSPVRKL